MNAKDRATMAVLAEAVEKLGKGQAEAEKARGLPGINGTSAAKLAARAKSGFLAGPANTEGTFRFEVQSQITQADSPNKEKGIRILVEVDRAILGDRTLPDIQELLERQLNRAMVDLEQKPTDFYTTVHPWPVPE